MRKRLTELEGLVIKAEGLRDVLAIIYDCAAEGANSLDNYVSGFYKISEDCSNICKELDAICQGLYSEYFSMQKGGAAV